MKRKILAMLMALAMIISMVPMAAMAAEECEHTWSSSYVSQGNATHAIACVDCGKPQHKPDPCSGFGANCWLCGGSLNPDESEEPACEHEWTGVVNKGEDGIHTVVCRDCLEELNTESHSFVDGRPCACGAIYVEDEEPECEHTYDGEIVAVDNKTHEYICGTCGEATGFTLNHADNDGDRYCDSCEYEMYSAECEHEWKGVVNNGEAGIHTIVCRDCEEVLGTESHMFVDNRPCACGAIYVEDEEPAECEHEWKGVVNNGEAGIHTIVCRDCLEELGTESHMFVDNRPCACGAIYVEDEEPAECEHEWKGVVNNGVAGIHTIVCRDCLEVLGVESHKFVDNRPCACGAIYVEDEEPAECEHEWKGVVNNGEAGIHTIVCRDCLEELGTESHKFVDNRPCACGAIYVHDHDYEAGVTSNEDGTHKINCSCGEFVTVDCLDNDGDGKCDSCGYQKYSSHECDFEAGVTSNEDGTHNVNCSCGEFVTVDCLDNDGDGKCDSCGYQKYEPECKHDYEYVSYTSKTIKYVCKHCGDVDIQSNAYYKLWQWCYDNGIQLRDNWWEGAEPWLNWFK